jgi:hypothetical protein
MLMPPTVPPTKTNVIRLQPPPPVRRQTTQADDAAMLKGSLTVVSALDLMEWLCCNGRTGILRLHIPGIEANVTIVSGQILDATWCELRGLDALTEIAACGEGAFDLVPAPADVERTLHGSWQSLLLGATQILDERNHDNSLSAKAEARDLPPLHPGARTAEHLFALPPEDEPKTLPTDALVEEPDEPSDSASTNPFDDSPATQPASTFGQERQDWQAWIDLGFAALREGDNQKAKEYWQAALAQQPDNRTLQFNLRRLDESARLPGRR